MKNSGRRSNSFRLPSADPSAASGAAVTGDKSSPCSLFWLLLHALCCLVSLVLGFRFSRLLFFLLFSSPVSSPLGNYDSTPVLNSNTLTLNLPSKPTAKHTAAGVTPNLTASRVVVGRHGILIRPWPHPDPIETMKAHQIMERVQQEQRAQYGVKNPRPVIVVTPTYVRTFQTLHLTGLIHTLMLVPYDLTWIVVEAGGISNETADLLARSKLRTIHLGFDQEMPLKWADRHKAESLMRIQALRFDLKQQDKIFPSIVLFGFLLDLIGPEFNSSGK